MSTSYNMVLSLSSEHSKAKKGIAIHTSCSRGATVACDDNDPQAKYHQKTIFRILDEKKTVSVCNKNDSLERNGVFLNPFAAKNDPGQKMARRA